MAWDRSTAAPWALELRKRMGADASGSLPMARAIAADPVTAASRINDRSARYLACEVPRSTRREGW
jgi:hypothetical protein